MRKPQSAGRVTERAAPSTGVGGGRQAATDRRATRQRGAAGQRSVINQSLAPVLESIIVGRWLAERACRQWRLTGALREVRQVVTELLANAVQHAGTPIVLTVSYSEPWLLIAVRDDCPALPRRVLPSLHSLSGRGLLLVEAFAHAWGAAPAGTGKVVWATIAARPVPGAPPAARFAVPLAGRRGIPFAGRGEPGVPPPGHPKTVSARSFRLAG